jgi:cyclic pyranopterin phosphate synthase
MVCGMSLAAAIPLPILTRHSGGAYRKEIAAASPAPMPAAVRQQRRLIDSYGRTIRHLRLSIIDRCNFRCVYCMEPDVRFMDRSELLTTAELVRLARVCRGLGVEQVRLTGGEPTVHPELTEIIRGVAPIFPGRVAMTTNGSLLMPERLAEWKRAGVSRITISIDSLSPDRFRALTRAPVTPEAVIAGIAAAREVGFASIKLNAVIVRGFNEDEIPNLAGLARRFGAEMRFIEYMPLDSGRKWDPGLMVSAVEVLARVQAVFPLREVGRDDPSSTAVCYEFVDGVPGRIGCIAPVTNPFCGACDRLRITADGKVRPCLFSRTEFDLRTALRSGASDGAVEDALLEATWNKQRGHGIAAPGFVQPQRSMSAIGG